MSGPTVILEGLMTTLPSLDAPPEAANLAPMGPIVDETLSTFVLRPFTGSTTYKNLKATGQGVFHVTDDALLLARAAVGTVRAGVDEPIQPACHVQGVVLTNACRYYELKVREMDDRQERTRVVMDAVATGRLRDFFGFNRARHAVLEAAILATRLHLTGTAPVLAELEKLRVIVGKTGGAKELLAMEELTRYVRRWREGAPGSGRPDNPERR